MTLSSEIIEKLHSYVTKNPPLYAPFLNEIADCESGTLYKDDEAPKVLYIEDDGLLLSNDWAFIFSAQTEDAANRIFDMMGDPYCVVSHEQRWEGLIKERFPKFGGKLLPCEQVCYLGKEPLPLPDVGVEMRTLGLEHLDFVLEHYKRGHRDYNSKTIESGLMIGAFRGDTMTGFIGVHDEGSMGMLEVLPEFRRQKIATALEIAMTNFMLERGRVPYGHVIVGNDASSALQRSLGFVVANDYVTWHSRHD